MAEKNPKNPLGATGEQVRANVERIRKAQGLTYKELSDRLAANGRPIPTLGLSRIDRGERRIDADDLVALAVVLGVNPNALLFPDVADSTPVEITGAERVNTAYEAWQWADGFEPLRDEDDPDEFHVRVRPRGRRRLVRFGERSADELAKVRATDQQIANSGQYPDPEDRSAFLEKRRQADREAYEGH